MQSCTSNSVRGSLCHLALLFHMQSPLSSTWCSFTERLQNFIGLVQQIYTPGLQTRMHFEKSNRPLHFQGESSSSTGSPKEVIFTQPAEWLGGPCIFLAACKEALNVLKLRQVIKCLSLGISVCF